MKPNRIYWVFLAAASLGLSACEKEEAPDVALLKNDVLKKTTGPAVVGDRLEFVYALGTLEGKLQNVKAEATLAGGAGTGFGSRSWTTDRATGFDVPTVTATDTITNGTVSTANLIDAAGTAVSLRYYYAPTEAAKGQNVSFRFSGTSSTGKQVTISTPEYRISRMDMRRLLPVEDGKRCYVSIADLAVYTKEEVDQKNLSDKIDFVYLYRPTMGSGNYAFGHALVALSNGTYLSSVGLPAAWTKSKTLLDKRVDVKDAQLRGSGFDVYIDDIDLERTTFSNATDNAFGLAADQGAFVQTADGVYTAYVFVNAVNNTAKTATISIKRLKMK
jgi:hypothetical protein